MDNIHMYTCVHRKKNMHIVKLTYGDNTYEYRIGGWADITNAEERAIALAFADHGITPSVWDEIETIFIKDEG